MKKLTPQEQRQLGENGWIQFIPPVKGCYFYKNTKDNFGKPTGEQIALNAMGEEVPMPDLSDIDGGSDGSKASIKTQQASAEGKGRRGKKPGRDSAGSGNANDDAGNGQQGAAA